MTLAKVHEELAASFAEGEQRRAEGVRQFDGDTHWNAAMKALAAQAVADAEKLKAEDAKLSA